MIDGDLMTIIKRKLKYNTMNKLSLLLNSVGKSRIKDNMHSNHSCNQTILAAQ